MPAPHGIVQWVDQELHRMGLLPRGGRLLVAVSGGADSVALLRLLVEINRGDYWKWTLVVGHVEHGIRGAASAADAAWVETLAGELGLTHDMRTLQLGADCSEAKARMRRHKALREMVSGHGCAGVVLAHHADDLAETVLMRMFRGCGVDGLVGMREESTIGYEEILTVWRPLLQVRRAQLVDYLKDLGQAWREDETNQSRDFLRNRVRAEVLPMIENIWPAAVEAVGRLSRIAGDAREVLADAERALWEEAELSHSNKEYEFRREVLREAFPALIARVLRGAIYVLWGTSEIADHERITEAVRLIRGTEGGKEIQMGRGVVVVLEEASVVVAVADGRRGRDAG